MKYLLIALLLFTSPAFADELTDAKVSKLETEKQNIRLQLELASYQAAKMIAEKDAEIAKLKEPPKE